MTFDASGRLPEAFLTPGGTSFMDFLAGHAPDLLPGRRSLGSADFSDDVPHGTTIVAATFPGGLAMAMQGLAVVPLFAGYDPDIKGGRIFSYDPTGGRYEETHFHSVGSGSLF